MLSSSDSAPRYKSSLIQIFPHHAGVVLQKDIGECLKTTVQAVIVNDVIYNAIKALDLLLHRERVSEVVAFAVAGAEKILLLQKPIAADFPEPARIATSRINKDIMAQSTILFTI